MLFNSKIFIFAFLPIALLGFAILGRLPWRRLPIGWLVLCSFVYYGWWDVRYVLLLTVLIIVNYLLGRQLGLESRPGWRKVLLVAGVVFNLCVLVYFKYANFFITTVNAVSGTSLHIGQIILPLGISFFTFQKIAYLVDAFRQQAPPYRFLDFCLFVMFFPQLIAGPITHHQEIMPQFNDKRRLRLTSYNMAAGISLFVIGLFKKVVLADGMAPYASPVFDAAAHGTAIGFGDAWVAALSYTLQLYFDFSGYSDMAIGLARMFGIRLPVNFDSPYKAHDIIDFWRRWHITLSRFLRDYLYISLGGNRRGPLRRYVNLMLTMLLGGLWHGAGWTFVFWGVLHGMYLVINHAWRRLRGIGRREDVRAAAWMLWPGRLLTFLAVVVAWVFFRAAGFGAAWKILRGLSGFEGFAMHARFSNSHAGYSIAILLLVVWFCPNSQEIMRRVRPVIGQERGDGEADRPTSLVAYLTWVPGTAWAIAIAIATAIALVHLSQVSEFIYYQF